MTDQSAQDQISVEVAYATPAKQLIKTISVPRGTLAQEVVALSGIANDFADEDIANAKIGIFGKALIGADAPDKYKMRAGDRIEIYRPLVSDPKEVRRRRAAEAAARQEQAAADKADKD